jgi:ABC-type multidrug transport system fused ATPase/permease subunit
MKLSIVTKIWDLLNSSERRGVFLLLPMVLITMLLETMSVGLVIPIMSLLNTENPNTNIFGLKNVLFDLSSLSQKKIIIYGLTFLVGVYFFKTFFLGLMAWWQTRFAFHIQANLSLRLFEHYLRKPYTFHLQKNTAQLIRNITIEVSMFTNLVSNMIIVVMEILVLVGLLSFIIYIEPIGAFFSVCVICLASWIFHRLTAIHVENWGEERQFNEGMRFQHLQQGLSGVKDVILYGRMAGFIENFRKHNTKLAHAGHLQQAIERMPRLWIELVAVIGLTTVVIGMLIQNKSYDNVLTTVGFFCVASFRLLPSVNRIFNGVQTIRYVLPAVNVIHSEFDCRVNNKINNGISIGPFFNKLELSQINFSYPGSSKVVLNNISLVIKKGETVGFIGKSGCGKSTLIDICMGLLYPDTGEVQIDGINITYNLRGWQNQIGYVQQSIYLTDDTLRRNVAFGMLDEQIDDKSVLHALKEAKLDEFLQGQSEGLETMVGERGVRLSGGQRQRIGIARALYHNPSILVLDEATSALDTSTEIEIMQTVSSLKGNKTVIIVAHRLSTLSHCDKIFDIEDGKLVGQISHKELIERSLKYN